jgi:hypothetical protein
MYLGQGLLFEPLTLGLEFPNPLKWSFFQDQSPRLVQN